MRIVNPKKILVGENVAFTLVVQAHILIWIYSEIEYDFPNFFKKKIRKKLDFFLEELLVLLNEAYEDWLSGHPFISEVYEEIYDMQEEIEYTLDYWEKISIKEKWIVMTRAFNVYHHHGLMAEKIGLTVNDLERKNYLQHKALTEIGEMRLGKTASILLLLDMYNIEI